MSNYHDHIDADGTPCTDKRCLDGVEPRSVAVAYDPQGVEAQDPLGPAVQAKRGLDSGPLFISVDSVTVLPIYIDPRT